MTSLNYALLINEIHRPARSGRVIAINQSPYKIRVTAYNHATEITTCVRGGIARCKNWEQFCRFCNQQVEKLPDKDCMNLMDAYHIELVVIREETEIKYSSLIFVQYNYVAVYLLFCSRCISKTQLFIKSRIVDIISLHRSINYKQRWQS